MALLELLILGDFNDIRVTNIRKDSSTGESISNSYTNNTISTSSTIDSNESITYKVDINNNSTKYYLVNRTITNNSNNLVDVNITSTHDVIKSNSTESVYITLTNNTIDAQNINLDIEFTYTEAFSEFMLSPDLNAYIKRLAGNNNATYESEDTNIKYIKRSKTINNVDKINENIVSTNNSNTPIYLWYKESENTIYWYTESEKAHLNSDSSSTFNNFKSLVEIDLTDYDTSNSTTMAYMFHNCLTLTSLDVSTFNTSKVTDMQWMFAGSETRLERNIDYRMNLNKIDGLTSFDTSEVTNMNHTFFMDINLTTLDLSNFDTSNVENMDFMFGMDLESGTPKLTTIYVSNKFVTTSLTSSSNMFNIATKLKGGSGTTYDANHVDGEYARIDGLNGLKGYFTEKSS